MRIHLPYAQEHFSLMRGCTASGGSLDADLRKFFREFYCGASSTAIRGQTTPQRISVA
jgi:hypothetical protein